MKLTTAIKICGVTDPRIAQQAVVMGANYIGLMMYQKSKRYIPLELAKTIAHTVKMQGGIPVAVFVDANAEEMNQICHYCDIDTVQLHGKISRASHSQLPTNYQKIYVRAVNPDGTILTPYPQEMLALDPKKDKFLFDNIQGGSGVTLNLNQFHYQGPFLYFLAGGLNSQNVRSAIERIQPYGVDVSTGIENNSGIKDLQLIKHFIEAAKS
jgi:phosphoribosylanthranilate isomerase